MLKTEDECGRRGRALWVTTPNDRVLSRGGRAGHQDWWRRGRCVSLLFENLIKRTALGEATWPCVKTVVLNADWNSYSASFEQSPKKVFMYYFDKLIRNWDTISKHSHTFRTSIWPNDFVLAQYTLIEAAISQYFFHLSDSHWHVLQHRKTLHERACDCLGTRTWYHQTRLRHAIKFHLSLATEI